VDRVTFKLGKGGDGGRTTVFDQSNAGAEGLVRETVLFSE
jgi:hypothetical protein